MRNILPMFFFSSSAVCQWQVHVFALKRWEKKQKKKKQDRFISIKFVTRPAMIASSCLLYHVKTVKNNRNMNSDLSVYNSRSPHSES